MKESEAWLITKKEYDAERSSFFLCVTLAHLFYSYNAPHKNIELFERMRRRLYEKFGHTAGNLFREEIKLGSVRPPLWKDYLFNVEEARTVRSEACLFLAEVAAYEEERCGI